MSEISTDICEISTEELIEISNKSFEHEAINKCSTKPIYKNFVKTCVQDIPIDSHIYSNGLKLPVEKGQCIRNIRTNVPREKMQTNTLKFQWTYIEQIFCDIYDAYMYFHGVTDNSEEGKEAGEDGLYFIPFSIDKYGIPIFENDILNIRFGLYTSDTSKIDIVYKLSYDVYTTEPGFDNERIQYEINSTQYDSVDEFTENEMTKIAVFAHYGHYAHMSKFYVVRSNKIMKVGDKLTIYLHKNGLKKQYNIYVTKIFGNTVIFELPTYIDLNYYDRCWFDNKDAEITHTYSFNFQAIIFYDNMSALLHTQ